MLSTMLKSVKIKTVFLTMCFLDYLNCLFLLYFNFVLCFIVNNLMFCLYFCRWPIHRLQEHRVKASHVISDNKCICIKKEFGKILFKTLSYLFIFNLVGVYKCLVFIDLLYLFPITLFWPKFNLTMYCKFTYFFFIMLKFIILVILTLIMFMYGS